MEGKPLNNERGQVVFLDTLQALTETLKKRFAYGSCAYVINSPDYARQLQKEGYRITEPCEHTRFTVAFGGEKVFYRAHKLCDEFGSSLALVPYYDCAVAPLGYHRFFANNFCRIEQTNRPDYAVFDREVLEQNPNALAGVFGNIFSLPLALFDACFNAQMLALPPPYKALNCSLWMCEDALERLKGALKRQKDMCAILSALQIRCAGISLDAGERAVFHSGASQIFEALRMLFKSEQRLLKTRGETEFMLCGFLSDYYLSFLKRDLFEFVAPPDNNKRMERICEYFGAELKWSCAHIAPLFSVNKMRIFDYRCGEYKNDNIKILKRLKNLYAAAYPVFKRIYADDGYSLVNYIDDTDLSLCLSLGPDVMNNGSMLSYIKQTGLLEKYIV